jgi:DNA polymerase
MSDSPRPSDADLSRQARQHLESLRAAGIEWIPDGPAPESLPAERPAAPAATISKPGALFQDMAAPEPKKTSATVIQEVSPMPERTLEERRRELKILAEKVAGCTRCPELVVTRTQTVFGVGDAGVELCFVGEAPGADEDAQGEPFVGAAGQLLNRIIAACNLKREEVYICNILKCRPPGNRTPLPNEAGNCREYLDKQLELVRPKFICALGSTAAQNLLGTTRSMGQLRGKFHNYRGIPVMCTYHPAYLLPHRNPGAKREVWNDMKMLMERMGRPVGK